jgi:hypothetical protein
LGSKHSEFGAASSYQRKGSGTVPWAHHRLLGAVQVGRLDPPNPSQSTAITRSKAPPFAFRSPSMLEKKKPSPCKIHVIVRVVRCGTVRHGVVRCGAVRHGVAMVWNTQLIQPDHESVRRGKAHGRLLWNSNDNKAISTTGNLAQAWSLLEGQHRSAFAGYIRSRIRERAQPS